MMRPAVISPCGRSSPRPGRPGCPARPRSRRVSLRALPEHRPASRASAVAGDARAAADTCGGAPVTHASPLPVVPHPDTGCMGSPPWNLTHVMKDKVPPPPYQGVPTCHPLPRVVLSLSKDLAPQRPGSRCHLPLLVILSPQAKDLGPASNLQRPIGPACHPFTAAHRCHLERSREILARPAAMVRGGLERRVQASVLGRWPVRDLSTSLEMTRVEVRHLKRRRLANEVLRLRSGRHLEVEATSHRRGRPCRELSTSLETRRSLARPVPYPHVAAP